MTVINTRNAETINITQSGTYDVARYTTAEVNVVPDRCVMYNKDANNTLNQSAVDIDSLFNGVTKTNAFFIYSFSGNQNITSANLSSLVEISGQSLEQIGNVYCGKFFLAFCQCRNLVSYDLSNLKKISGVYACKGMFHSTGIKNVSLPSLEVVDSMYACDAMFYNCSPTSVDVCRLVTLNGDRCFSQIFPYGYYENVTFYSLKSIKSGYVLNSALRDPRAETLYVGFPALTQQSFGSYTNQFNGMFGYNSRSSTVVTVHFPKNLESVIGSWSDVVSGYGLAGTVTLFDLPSTVTLTCANSVSYERNPKYDTQTALAWRVKDTGTSTEPVIDWTPYYTSGLTDPTVGTTIYSDTECTTAVTTVSSIA